jgi:hypothetical protein
MVHRDLIFLNFLVQASGVGTQPLCCAGLLGLSRVLPLCQSDGTINCVATVHDYLSEHTHPR